MRGVKVSQAQNGSLTFLLLRESSAHSQEHPGMNGQAAANLTEIPVNLVVSAPIVCVTVGSFGLPAPASTGAEKCSSVQKSAGQCICGMRFKIGCTYSKIK